MALVRDANEGAIVLTDALGTGNKKLDSDVESVIRRFLSWSDNLLL